MHCNYLQVLLGLAFAGINSALPAEDAVSLNILSERMLTPDNTCGNVFNGKNNGYICDPGLPAGGGCCSAYGYCGQW